eukprot:CAMPEP_0119108040 /NCGR_PEP_ID=MMETSP1180-20130426/13199_1 /TAXON_ID=3052 ORGANISM="Chlamydomonas cf sp, Strain CCMP681" /NCGR_SAMPLE_ID=MMETSP1180 /ASSEMBLY_ACC=CAM_ASM_000741 /LENGTH=248 /DNA_ID=CAMNT_0007093613 /DNA_START=45 /DNA_END=791 /DNA_ORIENTATION=-
MASLFYRFIIDDVVAKSRAEAAQDGVEESVLDELRARWEQKMIERGVMQPHGAPAALPPAPAQPVLALQGRPVPAAYPAPAALAALMANPAFAAQLANPAFTAQLAANPALAAALRAVGMKRAQPEGGFSAVQAPQQTPRPAAGPSIPQRDGPGDEEEADDEVEADGDGAEEDPSQQQSDPKNEEDLSSDSEEEDPEQEEMYNQNFVCCQFKSVKRSKNKWKVVLADGIMHVAGKDYCFRSATGEFMF